MCLQKEVMGLVGEERYFEGILQWVFFFFKSFGHAAHGIWDLNSPREDPTQVPQSLNHWTAREVPVVGLECPSER